MRPMRFIMLGGFLGAGKTTTIARLACHYRDRGERVAVITNDHASDLVDSHTLRSLGLDVGEIAGACFCGNLDDLITAVEQVGVAARPDVVLVEPVGSCTDLVATVIRPMQRLFASRFEVAPYGVLLKPSHGLKILSGQPGGGFSPKAEYIFRTQLEEADFVTINRIDQLSPAQITELERLLAEQYSTTPVLRLSAKTGAGFDDFAAFLEQRGAFGQRLLAVDYDEYLAGEAELGWFNGSYLVHGVAPFDLDRLVLGTVTRLQEIFAAADVEPGHLKAFGIWEGACSIANVIASSVPAELSRAATTQVPKTHLIINARVAANPASLANMVQQALSDIASTLQLTFTDQHTQCFRPGQPIQPYSAL